LRAPPRPPAPRVAAPAAARRRAPPPAPHTHRELRLSALNRLVRYPSNHNPPSLPRRDRTRAETVNRHPPAGRPRPRARPAAPESPDTTRPKNAHCMARDLEPRRTTGRHSVPLENARHVSLPHPQPRRAGARSGSPPIRPLLLRRMVATWWRELGALAERALACRIHVRMAGALGTHPPSGTP